MPAWTIRNHILHKDGAPVSAKAWTPNMGGAMKPEYLVVHFTGASSAAGAINWLCDHRAKASAHLVIDAAGNVTQLAPFNRVTWHAGKSAYAGRTNFNGFSVGIELVNAGQLAARADGKWIERLGGKVVPAASVIMAQHKNDKTRTVHGWQIYPAAQIAAARDIGIALNETYRLKEVVGHDEIAPGRKSDPGPAFPMASFESAVMGRKAV